MALIKDRKLGLDSWQLLELPADGALPSIPADGDVIVHLSVWRALRNELPARSGRLGIWLAGGEEPAEIADDLSYFELIAVRFTNFTDGRGYSVARLLRERYGWRGELRAIGDIQRDQLYYLHRCGFDAFELRSCDDVDTAVAAFKDFSEAYQTGVDRPVPLFRRRAAGSR